MIARSRAATILLAFLAACLMAAIVLSLTTVFHVAMTAPSTTLDTTQFFELLKDLPLMVGSIVVPIAVLAFLPASIVVGLAEVYRVRSFGAYLVAGVAIALVGLLILRIGLSFMFEPAYSKLTKTPPGPALSASWNFLLAGLVAGATYWGIAGQRTGDVQKRRLLKSTADVE